MLAVIRKKMLFHWSKIVDNILSFIDEPNKYRLVNKTFAECGSKYTHVVINENDDPKLQDPIMMSRFSVISYNSARITKLSWMKLFELIDLSRVRQININCDELYSFPEINNCKLNLNIHVDREISELPFCGSVIGDIHVSATTASSFHNSLQIPGLTSIQIIGTLHEKIRLDLLPKSIKRVVVYSIGYVIPLLDLSSHTCLHHLQITYHSNSIDRICHGINYCILPSNVAKVELSGVKRVVLDNCHNLHTLKLIEMESVVIPYLRRLRSLEICVGFSKQIHLATLKGISRLKLYFLSWSEYFEKEKRKEPVIEGSYVTIEYHPSIVKYCSKLKELCISGYTSGPYYIDVYVENDLLEVLKIELLYVVVRMYGCCPNLKYISCDNSVKVEIHD